MENTIVELISNLGFPIAVTAYLLVCMSKTLNANTEATNALSAIIQRLVDKLDGGSHE